MQMLRRIVVIVSVVVTASVAVGPSISAPAAATSEDVRPHHRARHRRHRQLDEERAGIPGMVVGIWDPKRGTYIKTFGTGDCRARSSRRSPPTTTCGSRASPRASPPPRSCSWSPRKLDLDAHLSEFVPDIANGDTITVEQLLNMTAGVFSYTEDEGFVTSYFADPAFPFTSDDALAIIRSHQPDFAPGQGVHYSDSNYVLLQLITEKVTGQPFGETIQTQILDKVGLDETSYPTTDAMPEPFSHGYLAEPVGGPRDVTVANPGVAGGAGAMISNLEDLHQWAIALGTGELLPAKLQAQRLQKNPLVTTPKVAINYGLGITNLNGFLGHDGGILGYATAMFYLPKAKATIVVESNSDNVSASSALWTFIGIASYLYPEQNPTPAWSSR